LIDIPNDDLGVTPLHRGIEVALLLGQSETNDDVRHGEIVAGASSVTKPRSQAQSFSLPSAFHSLIRLPTRKPL
jgi:hypothetical protein